MYFQLISSSELAVVKPAYWYVAWKIRGL